MPLILVSNRINHQEIKTSAPRLDYLEIARQLQGELIGYQTSPAWLQGRVRQLERQLKLDLVESIAAYRRSAKHQVVLSLSEKAALPLAVLFQLTGRRVPHVVIAHKLSSALKTQLFRLWRLQGTFSCIVCVSRSQADYAVNELGVSGANVRFIYDGVDHRFFTPRASSAEGHILAVGQEQRDYETLLAAVGGTKMRLIVVASSPWSTSRLQVTEADQVQVLSHISYTELRDLYAGARMVVVPLKNVDYAAGVNAVLEGMAMAKPVIVSRTYGISDYVVEGETGRYVTPGRIDELQDMIFSLWDRPDECRRLGANARQAVEEKMNLDRYVNNIVNIASEILTRSTKTERNGQTILQISSTV